MYEEATKKERKNTKGYSRLKEESREEVKAYEWGAVRDNGGNEQD